MHTSMVKPLCLNFRVLTPNILGVRKFRTFTIILVTSPSTILGVLIWLGDLDSKLPIQGDLDGHRKHTVFFKEITKLKY